MSLKTYILTSKEFNSNGQEGLLIRTFKAESLDQLNNYIDLWEDGYEKDIPIGRFHVEQQLPPRFFEAGGFTGRDLTFVCQETQEDMASWWQNQGWGTLKGPMD